MRLRVTACLIPKQETWNETGLQLHNSDLKG